MKGGIKNKMTREIKFRAWNKGTKDMISWEQDVKKTFQSRLELPECILMQFTGLKDKNGKEIFEGDIIKNVLGDVYCVEFITFNSGFYYCKINLKIPNISQLHETASKGMEVIGNKFENPELLK